MSIADIDPELYERRESLALDCPDLTVTDWNFVPEIAPTWEELIEL